MTLVSLGLDFGSTGLRAAFSRPGEPTRFVILPDLGRPWLLCEPIVSGVCPVSFPSIKSRLGFSASIASDDRFVDPFDVVTRALGVARRQVESATSAKVGQTVISVPARFTSAQRSALRDAAHAAGLAEVRLINDSAAAVIAYTGGERGGTFLVYGMGYSGVELGLVRALRGHYRVLGNEGAAAPGGSTFDEKVLSGLIQTLRQHRLLPDMSHWEEKHWLQLRDDAQRIKEELATSGSSGFRRVAFNVHGNQRFASIECATFEALVRHAVARTLDRAHALFAESGLTSADVDTVLLVGGGTQPELIGKLVAGLGGQVVPASPECIARGAALHAERLSSMPLSGPESEIAEPVDAVEDQAVDAPLLTATVLAAADAPAASAGWLGGSPAGDETVPDTASGGIEEARRLVGRGQRDEAMALLRKIIDEAQVLLNEIAVFPSPSTQPTSSSLHRARTLVRRRRYDEAVSASHLAWQQEPTRPEVFEAMIDIHCKAAMAATDVEHFGDAERWLRCAYGHDPSDTRVRGLLAERTYLHARELDRLGRPGEAIQALEQGLVWDPDHRATQELLHRLSRKSSVRTRGVKGGQGEA
ncbi:MAG: Hsp70 family protein [Pseudonocardiaceae bacterium]